MAKELKKFEASKVGAASDGIEDDKRYWVTVSRPVPVMGRMFWQPGRPIQAQGSYIRAQMEKPENDGLITVGQVVAEGEVI